jgi:Holliday junction resolvasome RuvABC endonuclease subunit
MTHPKKTILALDPGFREPGYAILAGEKLLAHGVANLRILPRRRRPVEVRRLLRHWFRTYGPASIVLERTHPQPRLTFNRVHEVATVVRRWARRRRVPVSTYAPQTIRKHVVGNGRATKREVALAIAGRFPALRVYVTQDRKWKERYFQNMFDAVALALHHRLHPPSRSRPCG